MALETVGPHLRQVISEASSDPFWEDKEGKEDGQPTDHCLGDHASGWSSRLLSMGSLGYVAPVGDIKVSLDRGGTFTDVVVIYPDGSEKVFKLLSRDPKNYQDAPIEALRRIVEEATGATVPRGIPLDLSCIGSLRMGTTVATNALLERQGAKTALFITRGFRDLLKIGNQSRPDMFALNVKRPDLLYSKVVEVSERVTLHDSTSYRRIDEVNRPLSANGVPQNTCNGTTVDSDDVVIGLSGERIRILERLNTEETRRALKDAFAEGFRSIAICFLHSYTFPEHELAVAEEAKKIGFTQVSISSQLSPAIKMLSRANSAVTDAYLTPEIHNYLEGFKAGVDTTSLQSVNWRIMQSDGGLVHPTKLSGLRALLSGPAGGVIGYARTCYTPKNPKAVVGFDMGGTSTDVSRYAGSLEHVFETTTAGVSVQFPQLDINTVAAGGGSVLAWRKGILAVGPQSAGSHPGPACYRKGGPATITDANLVLGRILPEQFPSIFGPSQDQPLDVDASYDKLTALAEEINRDQGTTLSVHEVASGFITVANETMCRPIRALTEAKGYATSDHILAAFGGAGGQHACDIARALGITRVAIHKYSSVLSAYGMALADTTQEERKPCSEILSAPTQPQIRLVFDELEEKATKSIRETDPACKFLESSYFLNLRYEGSDTSLMIEKPSGSWDFAARFTEQHHQEFGFTPTGRQIIIDDIRVRTTAKTVSSDIPGLSELGTIKLAGQARSKETKRMFFSETGIIDAPMFHLRNIRVGETVRGPAVVIDQTQTIVITPNATATALSSMLVIDVETPPATGTEPAIDPIKLSVFANRFMGIAEQMGRALQKTSVSTNIKERLDFSCAIFSADGGLVANAPHVPAMLGSMANSVRWQIEHWSDNIKDGDVFLSNAPAAGGAHLPDLTVISPVFDAAGEKVLFWTASRGHHADVGGIVPGSMPATSKEIWEEGAVIESIKIVENGVFHRERVYQAMVVAPGQYPGCEGARSFQDNMTDIKAQAAANQKGNSLIGLLIKEYTLDTVLLYMGGVQRASENAVRELFKKMVREKGRSVFEAEDFMDDGSVIQLKISIDPNSGSADFDFTGTSPQAYGIIYTLRCLVDGDIPLNQGCLLPVHITIPEGSLLAPTKEAAVAAGNGLTNQRLVDVILKAFEVCAASNGCMANFTFGLSQKGGFGYYETIAGGSGAGPSWVGEDGIHCHMTNTRITDAEVLERRYPVLLRRFGLRKNSGGDGLFRGGDGVIREVEFLIDMHTGILSERRVFQPYGMAGGQPAARGLNLWIRRSGQVINVGGKASCYVKAGDRLRICTPGGGGYGSNKRHEGNNGR
ncbi:Hydantoinase B/oxoprolinase-domain-containing protein [Aspergillus undulatus]|uniref:Hydantoinase B/oxoprolinase-domain-containing protein n=1 Tax=Aspergillus undulatus TaxID=1810928 RepID=UPI003CCDA773